MNTLLHPTYFPSISHFVAMSQADGILFEIEDNFQNKRTAIALISIVQRNSAIEHSCQTL
jgi:hypothetical protein